MTPAPSQETIKAELKELMKTPENLVCADCDDKRPTWASLIVPPPNAPFKETIGCFVCFQCSGAHRRMGTHICFVRSTNLDEWKEKELISMKQGGNKLVNGLFEATLTDKQRSVVRPNNRTDLETRTKYVFDKYQDRTWFSKDSYEACRPRDKIDAALSSLRSQKKTNELEEDFFSERAKNSSSGGSRSPVNQTGSGNGSNSKPSNNNDWWMVTGSASSGTPVTKRPGPETSGRSGQSSPGSRISLGDRRNLMSTLQRMESQSKLLDEFNHLDKKGGSLKPSELKMKTKSPRKTHNSSMSSLLRSPVKEVTSPRPRSTRTRRGVARTHSSSSSHSASSNDGSMKRRPRSSHDNSKVHRATSFDESFHSAILGNSPQDSTSRRNRVRKTNSDRAPPQSSKSLQGSQTFLSDISASLAQINMNASSGDNELLSPRRPPRRSQIRRGSVGGSSEVPDDKSQRSSRRATRDEQSQVSSSRGTVRSSSRHDDQSQTSRSRRSGSRTADRDRHARSPKRRTGSSPPRNPTSRTPSPDLIGRNSRRQSSPGGSSSTGTPTRSQKQGAPITISRVSKDRKPRIPTRATASPRSGPPRKLDAKVSSDMTKLFAAT